MTEPTPRRRSDDRVPAEVKLYVTDEVGETRHMLRGELAEALTRLSLEITAVGKKVEVGNLASINEFGQLKNAQADFTREIGEIKLTIRDHEPRIRRLEEAALTSDKVAEALAEQREQVERNRVQLRNWMLSLCGLLLGFAGFALANLH